MPNVATQPRTASPEVFTPTLERLLLIGPIAPPDTGPGIKIQRL